MTSLSLSLSSDSRGHRESRDPAPAVTALSVAQGEPLELRSYGGNTGLHLQLIIVTAFMNSFLFPWHCAKLVTGVI